MNAADSDEADRAFERMRRALQDELGLARSVAEDCARGIADHAWAYGLGPPMRVPEFRERTLDGREALDKAAALLREAQGELTRGLKVAPLHALALGATADGLPEDFSLSAFRQAASILPRLVSGARALRDYLDSKHRWACSRPTRRGRGVSSRHRLRFIDGVLRALAANGVPPSAVSKGLRIAAEFAGVTVPETLRALDRLVETRRVLIRKARKGART